MFKNWFFVLILLVLSNCATQQKNISLRPDFFSKPSRVLLGEFSGLEHPRFFKEGEQGLLDGLINDAFGSSLEKCIHNMDIELTVDEKFYNILSKRLLDHKFKVIRRKTPFERKDFTPIKEVDRPPYDFQYLKDHYGVDYAIILEPQQFGVVRSYYGFFPTSRPRGYAHLRAYCVRLEDNALEWYHEVKIDKNAGDNWDSSADYAHVVDASESAAAAALNDIILSFGDNV